MDNSVQVKLNRHFGIHVAKTMLRHHAEQIDSILLSDRRKNQRLREIEDLAKLKNVRIDYRPHAELTECSDGNRHQGVIVLSHLSVNEFRTTQLTELLDHDADEALILLLEDLQDPRNLGACLRSANAAGVNGVILPRNRGCAVTPTVSRTAAGAVETTRIYHASNLLRALNELKEQGYFVIGFDESATNSIYDVDFADFCVLVFGSEDGGLRLGTRNACDQLVRIPMHGEITSLNVSVAVGVATFEVVRQRVNRQRNT